MSSLAKTLSGQFLRAAQNEGKKKNATHSLLQLAEFFLSKL